METPCSCVILAGGLNRRFAGENKALLDVGGTPILERICTELSSLFPERILVTNDPQSYLGWPDAIVTDLFPVRSPLTGIHAGLFHMSSPHAFVIACDTPFVKRALVARILEERHSRWDVIIPATAEGLQPLFSIYSRQCLGPIESHLAQQLPDTSGNRKLRPSLKVQGLFDRLRVREIPESALRPVDPDLISFFNINHPEDLVKAEEWAAIESDETEETSYG